MKNTGMKVMVTNWRKIAEYEEWPEWVGFYRPSGLKVKRLQLRIWTFYHGIVTKAIIYDISDVQRYT